MDNDKHNDAGKSSGLESEEVTTTHEHEVETDTETTSTTTEPAEDDGE